jgi:hypothetical protein
MAGDITQQIDVFTGKDIDDLVDRTNQFLAEMELEEAELEFKELRKSYAIVIKYKTDL